mmetsp:Transcript_23727/g.26630  ORF Transcript_23727/g.26630 Transcript_23727/m.26630 type:complete len:130 (-) Transcript_23727:177-566(-)|eukprot:CAMPEP_0170825546 /NCGR_PEP_ID=MMETSP0733-20121128/46006_1 /TAXON_ID=186038 /ORGANISM="Fragilariopsis kerguelensis, Strain L26-C5" /LENGTH=129 /DNA_ID=CAMNT_0011189091 /DNA_START=203 /DNA_END=592 /DNA_ORIENTATION=-
MSDDGDKNLFQELIKSGVDAANIGLQKAQATFNGLQKPLASTKQAVEINGAVALGTAKTLYLKRKLYAPEIIGGSTFLMGGYFMLRRGRAAGVFGAVGGAGAAYSVVYDEFPPIDVEKIQNIIFGKKDE